MQALMLRLTAEVLSAMLAGAVTGHGRCQEVLLEALSEHQGWPGRRLA